MSAVVKSSSEHALWLRQAVLEAVSASDFLNVGVDSCTEPFSESDVSDESPVSASERAEAEGVVSMSSPSDASSSPFDVH